MGVGAVYDVDMGVCAGKEIGVGVLPGGGGWLWVFVSESSYVHVCACLHEGGAMYFHGF